MISAVGQTGRDISLGLKFLNLVLFQVGWLVCVWGAGNELAWLGPAFAVLFLFLHLMLSPNPGREFAAIAVAACIGIAADAVLITALVLQFEASGLLLGPIPLWLISLWLMFAMTLNCSMSWLHGRRWLSALLGAIAGPLCYRAGAALGAVDLHEDPWLSWGLLGLVWGVVLAILPGVVRRLTN